MEIRRGRLTTEASTTTPVNDLPTTWTLSRDYDAENHEIDGGNVLWGPNGHPALISTGTKFQTLHWDGNQLLFTTELRSGSGALVDIKVGSDGDVTPLDSTFQGLTFYDRGPGGLVLGCHNKQGTTYVGLTDARAGEFTPTNPVCTTAVTPSTAKFPTIQWSTSPGKDASGTLTTAIAPGTILGMPRPDGHAWGLEISRARERLIRALVRGQAHAYGGDIHDPGSLKSYMWNGNNGVSYADPTGYDPIAQGNDGGGGQPLFTDWGELDTVGVDDAPFGQAISAVVSAAQQALDQANSTLDTTKNYANAPEASKGAQAQFAKVIPLLGKGQEVGCAIECTTAAAL